MLFPAVWDIFVHHSLMPDCPSNFFMIKNCNFKVQLQVEITMRAFFSHVSGLQNCVEN